MEYLPEKKRTQKVQVMKKEEKTRKFREYLANNDVVLAIVKYILALRSADPKPSDPVQHLRDYFGEVRDPMWDEVDRLTAENGDIRDNQLPQLTQQLQELEQQLDYTKQQNRAVDCYYAVDPDRTRLSGFAKFDLDTKITSLQFFKLVEEHCTVTKEEVMYITDEEGNQVESKQTTKAIDDELFDRTLTIFERAFKEATPPFQGDLENETYKAILARLRSFVPQ
ncbi:UNKNOWN [Stylonychia lemnae]|uniref:Uncharacterized protein n=1 Tax=Stylonychia lemnae TaxID=5949 RepID=A0A077ZTR0_STYLE|nr:UNKNOWN [Stylonychia lemnae]|eukprot:CDW73282.1 UNKNOWN [Stylonychia lemnae]